MSRNAGRPLKRGQDRTPGEEHRRGGGLVGKRPDDQCLAVQAGQGKADGGRRADEQPQHLDHADLAEVEPAPHERAGRGADAREHEDGRDQLDELTGAIAENGVAERAAEHERHDAQHRAGDEAQEHRSVNVRRLDLGALHKRRRAAFEGQDDGERDEGERNRGPAELGGRDQPGERDGACEGEHLSAHPRGSDPANAGERRFSKRLRLRVGRLALSMFASVQDSPSGHQRGGWAQTCAFTGSGPGASPRGARALVPRMAATAIAWAPTGATVPQDVVFAFAYTSWSGALARELTMPEDRLAAALPSHPRVRGLVVGDPARSAPAKLARHLRGGRDAAFPDSGGRTAAPAAAAAQMGSDLAARRRPLRCVLRARVAPGVGARRARPPRGHLCASRDCRSG